MDNRVDFNVWFYSFTVERYLPSVNNNTNCSRTYFNDELDWKQLETRSGATAAAVAVVVVAAAAAAVAVALAAAAAVAVGLATV